MFWVLENKLMAVKYTMWRCVGQLSITKVLHKVTLLPSDENFRSNFCTHSSRKTPSIQLFFDFCIDKIIRPIENFTFLKQRGFKDLPKANIGALLPPVIPAAMPVMRISRKFPPEHFSDLSWYVLLIAHLQNSRNSSALEISFS